MTTEDRDPIFEYLDLLISMGWGSVPQPEIERIRRANGGVLPAQAPPEEPEEIIPVQCDHCGREFTPRSSLYRFCGRECSRAARLIWQKLYNATRPKTRTRRAAA